MGYTLSSKAQVLSQAESISPQIVLEIDGIDTIFGAVKVLKVAEYGDEGLTYGQPGLVYGGTVEAPEALDWISLQGTTNSIEQQLEPDKGNASSISRIKINLIDKDERVVKMFQPGNNISDILGAKARVYLNFAQGAHPKDSIRIFNGVIQETEYPVGSVKLTIAHPEEKKRAEIFPSAKHDLAENINDTQDSFDLDTTDNMLEPADSGTFQTYVQIDDEIIKYESIDGTTLKNCTRGQFGTTPTSHSTGTSASTVYRFQEKPITLALKLMLSNQGNSAFVEDVPVASFVEVSDTRSVRNAVFFENVDIQEKYGLVVGDLMTVTGAANAANNVTEAVIVSYEKTATGSIAILQDAIQLVSETNTPAVADFKSKYNVLPDGLRMSPDEVDVEQHERLDDLFGATFVDYDFRITEAIEGKDFINTQIYYPVGAYNLPRKGRASVGITVPPIADDQTKTLNESNVVGPEEIKVKRSTAKNFYNTVIYKYDVDLDDKFFSSQIRISNDSFQRISTSPKALIIDAKGLRSSNVSENFFERQNRRFIDRYRYGAIWLETQVFYGTGYAIEIGDIAIFGSQALKLANIESGNRNFQPRLMEVTNKSMNIKTGEIKLELTDTAFELDGRYATVAPSSITDSGSTQRRLNLKKSYGTGELEQERDKWSDFINEKVLVHDDDWTQVEEAEIQGFDDQNQNQMILKSDLSFAPPEGYIVDAPTYPSDADPDVNRIWKVLHAYLSPRVTVSTGNTNTQFVVSGGEGAKFFQGSIVEVHSPDFSRLAEERVVSSVSGDTITLEESIGFVPQTGDEVDLIGFPDEGLPYRLI